MEIYWYRLQNKRNMLVLAYVWAWSLYTDKRYARFCSYFDDGVSARWSHLSIWSCFICVVFLLSTFRAEVPTNCKVYLWHHNPVQYTPRPVQHWRWLNDCANAYKRLWLGGEMGESRHFRLEPCTIWMAKRSSNLFNFISIENCARDALCFSIVNRKWFEIHWNGWVFCMFFLLRRFAS